MKLSRISVLKTCPEVFCKKDILKKFKDFTENWLCRNLFFSNFESWRTATLIKRDSGTGLFLVNLVKFSKKITEHLGTTASAGVQIYLINLNTGIEKIPLPVKYGIQT